MACSFDTRPRFGYVAIADQGQQAPAAPAVEASPITEPSSTPVQDAGRSDEPAADAPSTDEPATEDIDAAIPPVSDARVEAPGAGPDTVDGGDADVPAVDAAPSDAGTSVDAMTEGAADSGGPFTPCAQHADCDTGLFCTAMAAWATPDRGGYCTAYCGNGWTAVCPQPSSGSVPAACQFATRLCELGSCERLQCPAGLQCIRTETQVGGGQVFQAFGCQ
jgi:hypothetical protein